MHLSFLAASFPQDYTIVRIYFETCFIGQPRYSASIKADRLAALFKLHAETAILYLELGERDEAVESLEKMLALLAKYNTGNTELVQPVIDKLHMMYEAEG